MSSNQAIGIVGQYILLNNYLDSGNQVDTVFMVFTPFSFRNNLTQGNSYNFFLKPFYKDEYKKLFTKTVNKQIEKIPYSEFCRLPFILVSSWAPKFITKDKPSYTYKITKENLNNSFLSPISIEYIGKIKELSSKYNFKLIILPTPTSISKKSDVEDLVKTTISKNGFDNEFKNYFNNIIYLNDSCFIDGTHFKQGEIKYYTEYYKNKLMQ